MATIAAEELFWDAFVASEYERVGELSDALKAAVEARPDDSYPALLRGLLYMWALVERERDPSIGPAELLAYSNEADTWLGKAYELNPADLRALGWRGAIKVKVGLYTGNEALVTEGKAMVDKSKEYSALFSTYLQSTRYEELSSADPDFALGVALKFDVLDLCVGEPIDRDNPDYAPHMAKATTEGLTRFCWNIPEAPHNFEGYQANLGELVLKQGNVDTAKVLFNNVKLSPDYETWPLRPRFETMLADDLAERASRYQDADPDNDPEGYTGPYACGTCHAKSIPE